MMQSLKDFFGRVRRMRRLREDEFEIHVELTSAHHIRTVRNLLYITRIEITLSPAACVEGAFEPLRYVKTCSAGSESEINAQIYAAIHHDIYPRLDRDMRAIQLFPKLLRVDWKSSGYTQPAEVVKAKETRRFILNRTTCTTNKTHLTYEDIVIIGDMHKGDTVVYGTKEGGPEGVLNPGEELEVSGDLVIKIERANE